MSCFGFCDEVLLLHCFWNSRDFGKLRPYTEQLVMVVAISSSSSRYGNLYLYLYL